MLIQMWVSPQGIRFKTKQHPEFYEFGILSSFSNKRQATEEAVEFYRQRSKQGHNDEPTAVCGDGHCRYAARRLDLWSPTSAEAIEMHDNEFGDAPVVVG